MGELLEKDAIKELFKKTRLNESAEPLKRLEFGYLEYARSAIEVYARKVLGYRNFFIEIVPSNKTANDLDFNAYWQSNKQCVQIFFKSRGGDSCKERISIAEALGLIVLSFIPEQLHKDTLLFEGGYPSIAFFAQKLLELSTKTDHGSFLRKQYTLSIDAIVRKICDFHGRDYVGLLTDDQRSLIDAKFNEIFDFSPTRNVVNGMLKSDIKLITQYIQRKEPYSVDGTQKKLAISISANKETVSLAGMLYCYESGCNIWYPNIEKIRDIRVHNREPEINALSTIRFIVAHELGHIVCHRIPGFIGFIDGPKSSTSVEEREATYFARLLLEHREFLYNNMRADEEYDKACLEIRHLIRQLYHGYGEEWLNWVLTD